MQHDCESSPQRQGTRPNKHTAKQLNSNLLIGEKSFI
jgi:hypothetical protein